MCDCNTPRVDDDATLPEADIDGTDPGEMLEADGDYLAYQDQEIEIMKNNR